MIPTKLNQQDEWRKWKGQVGDYCEEVLEGMKPMLEKAAKIKNEVTEDSFESAEVDWKNRGKIRWRFLKTYTAGDANMILTSTGQHPGWQAW